MPPTLLSPSQRAAAGLSAALILGAVAVAVAGARPYAGSWNDGSRLAAVESVADRGTLAIDDSVFVQVPPELLASGRGPYHPDNPFGRFGTRDKLFIAGRYHSDKPPVVSVLMAGVYRLGRGLGLPRAAERPDLFCLFLTLATSGLAYVAAVACLWRLGGIVGLAPGPRAGWVASFALGTVALPYTRHVNNHILLLGTVAFVLVQLARLAREGAAAPWRRPVLIGAAAGLAYNLDLAAGPLLLLCVAPLVAYRARRPALAAAFALAAAPGVVACHAVNYAVGGVLGPLNAVPAYLAWPGSPFGTDNMTGLWRHQPLKFAEYALALLFGKRGVVGHNLPLFLALPAVAWLLRRRVPERPEALGGLAWCGATWLAYAALSNNSSGACVSVRWFVPFVVPGWYLLALYLRELPARWADFAVLSAGGVVLGTVMWSVGPWTMKLVPFFWPIQGATLAAWLGYRLGLRRRAVGVPVADVAPPRAA